MRAVWVERGLDQRYGEQVEATPGLFRHAFGDISPVAFAVVAWQLAIPPVLDPGLIRCHRRILAIQCARNPWDGGLTAHAQIAAPLPAGLRYNRSWWQDRGWQDWPEIFGQYVEPAQQDLAKHPFLRASLNMQAPLPLDGLPPAPAGPGEECLVSARRAVVVIAQHLNDLLAPILLQLDSDDGRNASEAPEQAG